MNKQIVQINVTLDFDDPSIRVLSAMIEKCNADWEELSRDAYRYREAITEIETATTSGLALSGKRATQIFKICRMALEAKEGSDD